MWERMAAPLVGERAEGVDEPSMLFITAPVLLTPVPLLLIPFRIFLIAAPTKLGPEVGEAEVLPLAPLLTSGTTAMEAVRVTSVVSGVWYESDGAVDGSEGRGVLVVGDAGLRRSTCCPPLCPLGC